jgi:predicted metal-dependent hydrolase
MLNPNERIRRFYEDALSDFEIKSLHISFYPYKTLRHTIKVSNAEVRIVLSDVMMDAPLDVHHALAEILVAKLTKKKPSMKYRRIYSDFVRSYDKIHKILSKRIRINPAGKVFNLEKIFNRLNELYFDGQLEKPLLSWSNRKSFRKLGHYDPHRRIIVISKTLDDAFVPEYVIEFLLYHEMLHIKHPSIDTNSRTIFHTPEFRSDERKFPYFAEAMNWLEKHRNWLRNKSL